jgi:hypothetical protein
MVKLLPVGIGVGNDGMVKTNESNRSKNYFALLRGGFDCFHSLFNWQMIVFIINGG